MNLFRVIIISSALLSVAMLPVLATPSVRKIAPVAAATIGARHMITSRDGRFLVLFTAPSERASDCKVFDRRTHNLTKVPGNFSGMAPLCFSRDGQRLWVCGNYLDKVLPGLRLQEGDHPFVGLYDFRSKRYVRALLGLREESDVPSEGVLSRDGRTLIFSDSDGWLYGYSTRTGRIRWRHRVQGKANVSVSIVLNHDGSRFLRTADDQYGKAKSGEVVSTRSRRVLSTVRLPLSAVGAERGAFSNAQFAPRGSQVAVFQSDEQQWVFFDTRTAKVQWKMVGASPHGEDDLVLRWSPDARLVAVPGPKGLEVHEARTGRILEVDATFQRATNTFSASGSSIYALMDNDTGFGAQSDIWQWHLFPSARQRRADARFMQTLRRHEMHFAFSARRINQSLIQASRCGDPARVTQLLSHGANSDALDGQRDSALVNAVTANDAFPGPHRYYETAKMLIAHGANVKKRGGYLLASAAYQNPDLLKLLLAHGANANDSADEFADVGTPLHAAAEFAHLQNVRILLEHGARPNARNVFGKTPLMILVRGINPDLPLAEDTLPTIRLLIKYGADVNVRDEQGQRALDLTDEARVKAFLRELGAKG